MLIIGISADTGSNLTFSQLQKYDIPVPPNGFDTETNDNIVMKFEDEQEAIDYTYQLDSYANSVDNQSEVYRIAAALVKAINDDGFVRTYTSE